MVKKFRRREGKHLPYVEFDWIEGRVTLKYLRYFPEFNKVYVPVQKNPYNGRQFKPYEIDKALEVVMIENLKAEMKVAGS